MKFFNHKLDNAELLNYAQRATELRRMFREKASGLSTIDESQDRPFADVVNESKVKLYRDIVKDKRDSVPHQLLVGYEHEASFSRRKKRKLSQLSAEERVSIAKLAATKTLSQKEIAESYNVSVSIVSQLLHNLRHRV